MSARALIKILKVKISYISVKNSSGGMFKWLQIKELSTSEQLFCSLKEMVSAGESYLQADKVVET